MGMKRHPGRNRRVLRSSSILKIALLLVLLILGVALLFTYLSNPQASGNKKLPILSNRLGGHKHRIAIIIPFVGEGPEAIPPYLELFCASAAGSSALVDFLLIHNGVLDEYHGDKCPKNVIFISLQTMNEFSRALVKVVDQVDESEIKFGSKEKLAKALTKLIDAYPYLMVEFKGALGHIFSEYIKGYSHWGYSDIDILFGDLPRFITDDELEEFDIVTYSFGDQNRLYLRGQFTFHKNNQKINQLWRSCTYLTHMDERFVDIMSGNRQLHFESAEGCYSNAILQQPDIKVKYAVKAFTDVRESDTMYTHGLYVSTGGRNDAYTLVFKAGSADSDGKSLALIADKWFDMQTDYNDRKKPIVWEYGEREQVEHVENPDAKCMYWAQQKYQSKLCVDSLEPDDTVFWINGVLYKQKHEKMQLPGNIITAPFFHFQEWKRYYRTTQLTGFHRGGALKTFVLTKEGVLPIFPHEFSRKDPRLPSPLGIPLFKWNGVKKDIRKQLPGHSYCLESGPRKKPASPPAPNCRKLTSWRDKETVEILSGAPAWTQLDIQAEVTMVLTLQIQAEQAADSSNLTPILNLLAMYLNRWQGQPSVIVIHVAAATPDTISKLRAKLGPGSDLSYYGMDTCLVGAIFSREAKVFSRKALLNMAFDAAPTRWVLSGFEIERGIAISQDTAFFAHRVAASHDIATGSVHILPQFGVVNEENDFTIPSLFKTNKAGNNLVETLSQIDREICNDGEDNSLADGKDHVFMEVHDLWMKLTQRLIAGEKTSSDEKSIEEEALMLDEIQLKMISLLAEKKHYDLFAFDVSPILLIDNLGPRSGIMTSDFVREVEEFGGKLCYNGLRLSQLATYGYNINVLAGAFGLSTPTTRSYAASGIPKKSSLGTSRCDGCFFFDEEHEEILESISKDERARPAKAALLWIHEEDGTKLRGHT